MLQFFRKYQKIFFVVVTVFIVISFTFFGTFNAMVPDRQVPDRVIGKAVDGSKLSYREVEALTRFLSTSREDRSLIYSGKMPNLLNDNVIHRDFLATGMGVMLAEKYFERLQKDLDTRISKIKSYKPYVHPQAPFINVRDSWQRFVPAINEHLAHIQQLNKPNLEMFALLSNLYAEQSLMPPDILVRILSYQQKQFSWIQEDPRITPEYLSLFGYQTMEDWFGTNFIELTSQFILNTSIIAEKKGYKVSNQEVRAELMQNAADSLQAFAQNEESPTAQQIAAFYQQQLQTLGMDEATAINAWKKVVLFRRLFNDVGSGVLLDPMLHEQYLSYAKEAVSGDLYQLPEVLRFNDFRSMLKLQVYLDGVSKHRDSLLALPKYFLSADEVEKRVPQLVQRRYVLEFAEVKKEELEQNVSLKETWAWELEDGSWNLMQKEFPKLVEGNAKTKSERFELLEKMDSEERLKVDQFARGKILEGHPEWITNALKLAEVNKEEVHIRSKEGKMPIKGVKDPTTLLSLLHATALKGEENPTEDSLAAKEKLARFSADGNAYYAIQVIERSSDKEIATFKEASSDGTLDLLLDRRLEEAYPEVKKKDSIFKTDSGFKPFKEVKDMVGYYVFSDLLRAIEQAASVDGKDKKPLDFYVASRFLDHLKQAKESVMKDANDPNWIRGDKDQDALASQWLLVKTPQEIKRCASAPFAKDELFTLPEGSWSSVAASARGDAGFFHLIKKSSEKQQSLEKVLQGQQLLGLDAKRDTMRQLLQEISAKNAISLSIASKEVP